MKSDVWRTGPNQPQPESAYSEAGEFAMDLPEQGNLPCEVPLKSRQTAKWSSPSAKQPSHNTMTAY